MFEQTPRNGALVYDKGIPYIMEFTNNEFAQAVRGFNRDTSNHLMTAALAYNRILGGLYTRFNPEFPVPNLSRDRMEATVNAAAKMGWGSAGKLLNPISILSEMNTIRRNAFKTKGPRTDGQVVEDAMYGRFRDAGGSTGGLALLSAEDIDKTLKKVSLGSTATPTKRFEAFVDFVNNTQEMFEDSTRFATFKRGIQSGMSDQQAALAARDSSFDPLVQGSRSDYLRSLFLFVNPSIQGMRNIIRTMKNP